MKPPIYEPTGRRGLNYYIKDSLRAAMGCADGEDTGNT
jgi:hypothetical protein